MASALSYLHNMEPHYLIHRDVKPSNFMLTSTLDIKLGDFGVSRLFRKLGCVIGTEERLSGLEEIMSPISPGGNDGKAGLEARLLKNEEMGASDFEDQMEQTGNVGTARYMAPEVRDYTVMTANLRGTQVKSRYSVQADVFALGMVLYYVFEARPPTIGGAQEPELHFKLLNEGVRPAYSRSTPAHRRIIDVCLRQKPSERPTSLELIALFEAAPEKVGCLTMSQLCSGSFTVRENEAAEAVYKAIDSRIRLKQPRRNSGVRHPKGPPPKIAPRRNSAIKTCAPRSRARSVELESQQRPSQEMGGEAPLG